jgi:NodT family efflux transporter outer membrane factor (OMF) lipoprotein
MCVPNPTTRLWSAAILTALTLCLSGCTSWSEYVANRFKVGPNYCPPAAPVADRWIDADDARVRSDSDEQVNWWTVFRDEKDNPDEKLNALVLEAYRQNLTLRQAGMRILEARAQRAIAAGSLFPQTQQAVGSYSRNKFSENVNQQFNAPEPWYDLSNAGFNLAWELDFWGRFRRAVESADADLSASVENYDDVLVTLLADVATAYVQVRTLQRRIALAEENVAIQTRQLEIAEAKFRGGITTENDPDQARVALSQTQALIPALRTSLRQAQNQLCILRGRPPRDLKEELGVQPIPGAPTSVAAGIPAQLLTRRPDVRRAERLAAAQSAQIGIATAELYPHIAITGSIGVEANHVGNLFDGSRSMAGSIGPGFQWNVLNYGRLKNNIVVQDARFEQLVAAYQNTVLRANAEVENGLSAFLNAQEQVKYLAVGVEAADKGLKVAEAQFKADRIPFVAVALLAENKVQQEDNLAQAQGNVALGLIQVYRALGGGWQIRLADDAGVLDGDDAEPPLPNGVEKPPQETVPK